MIQEYNKSTETGELITSEKIFSRLPNGLPEQNLAEFIRMARHDLTALGAELDWSAWRWKGVGMFLKLGVPTIVKDPSAWHMRPEFVDFAKAYTRYQIAHNPRVKVGSRLLALLRVVEQALIKLTGLADPKDIDLRILNEAALIAKNYFQIGQAYTAGRELEILAQFLSRNGFALNETATWRNPNPSDNRRYGQLGEEADNRRKTKLPDQRAVNAIGQVFATGFDLSDNATHPDVYVTSAAGMLMAAPSRIGEIHELPANLEIEELDSHGELQYGWRYRAFKNNTQSWRIKWIPADWVPIAKEAVRRIRTITEEPRAFAQYVENQLNARAKDPSTPLRFYRHTACPDVPDDQPLTAEEATAAIGLSTNMTWVRHSLRQVGLSGAHGAHTLNSLWLWVLKQLPKDFPYVQHAKSKRLKYSEALFCMHRHQLKKGCFDPVSVWLPRPITLGPLLTSGRGGDNFFGRHGFFDEEGQPLRVTSHQFRHLLNTIAHEGSGESFLGAEAINFWSGRDRMWQGQTYDHEPLENKVRRAADALKREDGTYAVIDIMPKGGEGVANDVPFGHWQVMRPHPTSCVDIELVHRSPVLWTFYGGCEHDWLLEPCQHHKDCLNCKEYFCIKGIGADDMERLDRLRKLLPPVIEQQERAKVSAERGDPGAQYWYDHQTAYRQRVEQLIGLLENTDVPVGAKIRLADSTANSHLHRVLKQIALQSLDAGTEKQDIVDALVLAFSKNKGLELQGREEKFNHQVENNNG